MSSGMTYDPIDPPAEPWAPARVARAVGIAFDLKKLILAAAGLLLTSLGWEALDRAFGLEPGPARWIPAMPTADPTWAGLFGALARTPAAPVLLLSAPFRAIFDPTAGAAGMAHAALAAAWTAAVWGIVGGAIGRIAVVQAATVERVGLASAVRFALGRWAGLVAAPLCPLLGVALLALPCAAIGLLYRLPDPGPAVAGVLAFLPLLLGLAMAVILLGLAVGWPLMHLTVAAEGEDLFDALSRSYSYVNQRLPLLVACLAVATVAGLVGVFLVELLARVVVGLAAWSLSLGGPAGPIADFFGEAPGADPAGRAHSAWLGVVAYLVRGWSYSYLWSAAAVIYLILRRDVDGTPWHAIYFPAHDADTFAPEPAADAGPGPEPGLEQGGPAPT